MLPLLAGGTLGRAIQLLRAMLLHIILLLLLLLLLHTIVLLFLLLLLLYISVASLLQFTTALLVPATVVSKPCSLKFKLDLLPGARRQMVRFTGDLTGSFEQPCCGGASQGC